MKKRYIALIIAVGIAIGWITLGGTQAVLHATSTTEFCVSCHTMEKPLHEYQGSVHFSNQKGIRAECADCHIPEEPIDYLITKIRASKDIYHEFVTGKIDTDEKYEEHRLAMAETVWAQMRENDSATCRSCHSFDAMETYDQSASAQKMHAYGRENNQTCIDCHKGVAHFAPQATLDTSAFDHLFDMAKNTKADAEKVYPIESIKMADLATINPTVELTTVSSDEGKRTVTVSGYQMKGAESVIYMGEGQRSIIATLTDTGIKALTLGEANTDAYGNEWRSAELTGDIEAPVLASNQPLWDYAEQLDNVYCSTCHAKIAASHFTVNSWGPVAKGMGARTDISELNLEILTKFFQNHAKDVANHK
ncbi:MULTISPECIES: NapC/NirT family cytochrome c [unclassified Aliivibrio]|uniref:NapC/NirT family cytochrome c n=1 Tax=unclassified Aliivibrio TaxID=2645654 RepID=UPI00080EA197|nr:MULTISPECIES: NapC/NirT family cytochrome c [unclassified Aliivibrio]OCH15997.1 cytochrome C [Aliivibrio sp. 1S165]OCH19221.1 cytochrome C [Aliivibrio sp. 1S128]OCH26962.1 cytochrome C [Aliivibrio sp. 1S175]